MDRRGGGGYVSQCVCQKANKGTVLHCLPTYKVVRAGRFTNTLLAMLVMALLFKYLRMTAD